MDEAQFLDEMVSLGVEPAKIQSVLADLLPTYEEAVRELTLLRQYASNQKSVESISKTLERAAFLFDALPDQIKIEMDLRCKSDVSTTLGQFSAEFDWFQGIFQRTSGNQGLTKDDLKLEVSALEFLVLELSDSWPEEKFNHDIAYSNRAPDGFTKGRFLRFVHAVTEYSLKPNPSLETLSNIIRSIQPKLKERRKELMSTRVD